MNVKNFKLVLKKITNSPKCWKQDSWHCGTQHCFGGWAQVLSGKPESNHSFEVTRDARQFLEITHEEGKFLFHSERTIADFKKFLANGGMYNAKGFDSKGFDKNGYNKKGFDRFGFDKNGFDRFGYDRDGYDKEGYDRAGYDRAGYSKQGRDRSGFDRKGYDKDGYDQDGLDKNFQTDPQFTL